MFNNYFCKLVSGFLLNVDKTTAVITSGHSRSIIIKKKNIEFVLWLAIMGSFREGVCLHVPKGL